MIDTFIFSFNAVMPILLLALTGYLLKVFGFADDSFFKKANALVFRLFLPILLFMNVYEIESIADVNFPAMIYCVFAVLIIFLVGYIAAKLTAKSRKSVGVITQCSFRSNYAIIGLPLAESLGGAEAVAFAGILSAVTIPTFNTLAVIILSHYANGSKKGSVKSTLKATAKNPLILGVFCGLAVVAIRNLLPVNSAGEVIFSLERDLPFLYSTLSSLARVASPLALVVMGARFDFSSVRELLSGIVTGTLLRLVFAPLFGIGVAVLLSQYTDIITLSGVEYPALISLFTTPVAVSSAVMTGEIGGDEQLACQLVVWTSIFSMPAMFLVIFIMKSFALI